MHDLKPVIKPIKYLPRLQSTEAVFPPQHVLIPKHNIPTLCDNPSVCYTFENMRTV